MKGIKSLSAGRKKLPRKASDLSKEELLLTLAKKRECNARALKIVEDLLEPQINREEFLEVLQHINQSHLSDIIDERAILKLCGYPLCSKTLQNVPSQQFYISSKQNKVYDISQRKLFCSNFCFKACRFIKDQMLTSPLWLRDIEPNVNFKLMSCSESSCGAGDEVNFDPERVTSKELNILKSDTYYSEVASPHLELQRPEVSDEIVSGIASKIKTLNVECTTTPTPCRSTSSFNEAQERVTECFPMDTREEKHSSSCCALEQTYTISQQSVFSESGSPKVKETNIVGHPGIFIKDTEQELGCIFVNSAQLEAECEKKLGFAEVKLSQRNNIVSNHVLSFPSDSKTGSCEPQFNTEVQTSGVLSAEHEYLSKNICEETDRESRAVSKDYIADSFNSECVTEQTRRPERKSTKSKEKNSSTNVFPLILNVEKSVKEWFTIETMCFLYGEAALKEILEGKGESIMAYYKALSSATWDPAKHERFLALCKRLTLAELEENRFDNKMRKIDNENLRLPLPDYNVLKEESKLMDLKVQAFFKGKMDLSQKKVSFAENTKESLTDTTNVTDDQLQLPLVHVHSQRALRKKIVFDGLNRILPDFFRTLGLRSNEMTSTIRGLVGTFSLSSSNITFKPQEWSLVGLIVIKILSVRDPRVRECLESEQARTFLTLLMMSYKLEPEYLDRLLIWLTDIEELLSRTQAT